MRRILPALIASGGAALVIALLLAPSALAFTYGNNTWPYPPAGLQSKGTDSMHCGMYSWSGVPPYQTGYFYSGVGSAALCPHDVVTAFQKGSWTLGPAYFSGPTTLQITANVYGHAYLDSVCPNGGGGDSALWVNLTANFQNAATGVNYSATDYVLQNVAYDYTSCSLGVVSVPIAYRGTTASWNPFLPAANYYVWVNVAINTVAYAGLESGGWSSACAEMPYTVLNSPYCVAGAAGPTSVSNVYVV
jgi:hypothetical protein